MTTTLLPGLLKALAQSPRARHRRRRAVRDRHGHPAARHRRRADPARRPPPDRGGVGRPAEGAARPAAPPRLGVFGNRERSGWWGEGPSGELGRRHRGGPRGRDRARARVSPSVSPVRRGTPAAAPSCSSARCRSGSPASCTHGCAAYGVPARTAVAEVDLDELLRATLIVPAPRFSTYPVAKEDVALVVDATCRPATWPRRSARAPASCASRCGCSTSTPATRCRRQEVPGVRAALPRPRPHADRGRDRRRPRRRREAGGRAARRRPTRLTAGPR